MSLIKLYGTHCPKCNVIEKKLTAKGIEFELVDNPEEVLKFGEEHNMHSAPILVLQDGTILDFTGANKFINTL